MRALRRFDLTLHAGDFVAVMGPSGCGKSTLLHLVGGLDTPLCGDVVVDGTPLTRCPRTSGRARAAPTSGFVFQFFNLLEGMSALDNVVLPAAVAGASRKQAQGRAHELLDLLGLGDKAREPPAVLSGGERRAARDRPRARQPADAAAR